VSHKIIALGDIHAPFHSKDAISWALDKISSFNNVTHVVQLGDSLDLFSFSKFARNPWSIRPEDELQEGYETMVEIWKLIGKAAPKAKKLQIKGNHCDRLKKRIIEKFPEVSSLVDVDKLFTFENVKTVTDSRECLNINGILFTHGWKSRLGDHAKWFSQSTVCGHTHRGGVIDIPLFKEHVFELNAGYLASPEHEALKYPMNAFTQWTHGIGVIDEHGPRFIRKKEFLK